MGVRELQQERDGFERLAMEALRLLDEHGLLLEFRQRMAALDERAKATAAS